MQAVVDKTHAKLGPSSWDRWSNCPGSVVLSEGMPNKSSLYAAEGTVAHEVADRVLREEVSCADRLHDVLFQVEGYDIIVDDEMVEAVGRYVEIVQSYVGEEGILMPEQQVPIGHMTGEVGASGTSDAIVFNGKRMTVIDLKYGKGVRVSAEGNGQGRMYALGALEKYGSVFDIEEVEIVIVQPRLEDGVTSELLNIGELEEFKDQVELAAASVVLATDEPPIESWLQPGEKQCKFCPAKGICPALAAETSNALALVSSCTAEDFADLTLPKQAASISLKPDASNEKLAEFMRAVSLIEAAVSGVRAEVERRLFEGQQIPGFYLGVGKRGNRQWSKDVDIETELKKRLGATVAYEKKLISVATAEKLFKPKPKTWAKIKDLVTQAEGKASVCQDGDKNPVYTPVSADDFADLSAKSEIQRLLD